MPRPQPFGAGAVERAWYWSEGRPRLVNAPAREVTEDILGGDFRPTVTAGHFDQAADNLARRRGTRLDSLMAREPRVRRLLQSMSAAAGYGPGFAERRERDDDPRHRLESGLVKRGGKVRPANPIYARVMAGTLNPPAQAEPSRPRRRRRPD